MSITMTDLFYTFIVRICYKLIFWATGKKVKKKKK